MIQKYGEWTEKYSNPKSQAMNLASPPPSYMILNKTLVS